MELPVMPSEDMKEGISEHMPTTSYYWETNDTENTDNDEAIPSGAKRASPEESTVPTRGPKRNKFSIEFKVQVAAYALETSNSAAGKQFNVDESLVRRWREQKPRLEALMNMGDPQKRLRLPRGTYTGRGPGATERRTTSLAQQAPTTPEYERVPALTQFVEEQSGMLTSLLTVNPSIHQMQNAREDLPSNSSSQTPSRQQHHPQQQGVVENGVTYSNGSPAQVPLQAQQNGGPVKVYSEQDMQNAPTLADLVRCSKFVTQDMPLLASAVDVPDIELEALKQQFGNPAAQALQLLKIWQKNIGGSRGDLYELIQLLSSSDSSHNH